MQEDEPRELFTDVTMRLSQPLHAPIHLEVAASYLRITTVCICVLVHGDSVLNRCLIPDEACLILPYSEG